MAAQRPNEDDAFEETPQIRLLRRLVTGLIVVLILAVLTVATTIVIRLGFGFDDGGDVPVPGAIVTDRLVLPQGFEVSAVGRSASGSIMIFGRQATGEEVLMTFDAASGDMTASVRIERDR